MFRNFVVSEDGMKFEISVNLRDLSFSNNNDEFTLLIVDYNSQYGLGEQYVVHNYTQIIKIKGQ